MSNINVVQSCWNFAHFSKIKKWACSQNFRSLSQKTKIWWHNVVSRRFGKYSFQILLSLMGRNSNIDFYELTWQKMWHLNVALLYQAFLWFSDLDARVRDLKSSFEYTSLFCKVTLLYAHAALLCMKKKVELKKIYLSFSCMQSAYSAKKFWVALSYVLPLFGYKVWHLRHVYVLLSQCYPDRFWIYMWIKFG